MIEVEIWGERNAHIHGAMSNDMQHKRVKQELKIASLEDSRGGLTEGMNVEVNTPRYIYKGKLKTIMRNPFQLPRFYVAIREIVARDQDDYADLQIQADLDQ